MKLDGATIPIERRSVGSCIDLALTFLRAHLPQVLGLTALFAMPTLILVYLIASVTEAGLALVVVSFVLISPYLGVALVAGAGYRVFGDTFDIKGALDRARPGFRSLPILLHLPRLMLALLLWAIFAVDDLRGSVVFVQLSLIPLLLILRSSFQPEIAVLEQLRGRAARVRSADVRRNRFLDLMIRWFMIFVFSVCAFLAILFTVEQGSTLILGYSLLTAETTSDFVLSLREAWYRLRFDPLLLCVIQAILWFVYPLARLSWFFCYLDLRIRNEGWDVELDFRIEARKLEPGS